MSASSLFTREIVGKRTIGVKLIVIDNRLRRTRRLSKEAKERENRRTVYTIAADCRDKK